MCSGTSNSWLEPVIEHLVGRQGQPRGAQVHAMYLSDQKRVDPGSTPSGHSGASYASELPQAGPAFPPGAQSLVQAMT